MDVYRTLVMLGGRQITQLTITVNKPQRRGHNANPHPWVARL
jgi:hypothetical protein